MIFTNDSFEIMILVNSLTLIFFKEIIKKKMHSNFISECQNRLFFFFFPKKSSHLSCCHILGIASYKAADNSFIRVNRDICSISLKSGMRIRVSMKGK